MYSTNSPAIGVYFCNPGEYTVTFNFNHNFTMQKNTQTATSWNGFASSVAPPNPYTFGLPQANQQTPGLYQYQAPLPAQGHLPHCDSGSNLFHYQESSSGMEESYASGISCKGIPSTSWSFNTPNQVYSFGNTNNNNTPSTQFAGTFFENLGNEPGGGMRYDTEFTKTDSTKQGCFPTKKHCSII